MYQDVHEAYLIDLGRNKPLNAFPETPQSQALANIFIRPYCHNATMALQLRSPLPKPTSPVDGLIAMS